MKVLYNDALDPDEQISAEEQIAFLILEAPEIDEETCADLSRAILKEVLKRFRPDLCEEENK